MSETADEMRALTFELNYLGTINAATLTDEQDADISRRIADINARMSILRGFVDVAAFWRVLTDEQRHKLSAMCCRGCGSLDTSCRCWDDE